MLRLYSICIDVTVDLSFCIMKTLNAEPQIMFWILLCIFIQVSDTQEIYHSTGNTTYCYNNHTDFCVLCGCFETGLTEHTLSCGENEVIRMEYNDHPIKSRPFVHDDNNTCILTTDDREFCRSGFEVDDLTTAYTDRLEVYSKCTLQNTCNVTVKPVEKANVKLVRYPYVCESNTQDISMPFSGILSNATFYFNGLDYIGQTMDCYCSLYKSSGSHEVEIFYIHGDNICNKFNILPNTQLVRCTVDGVQLYTAPENIQSNFLKIEITNMTITGDEVAFFKVHGDDLDVFCSGCTTNPNTQMYISTGNTKYCYKDPDFCVLCGCFETGLTEHTLSCGKNEVIRMEFDHNDGIKSLPLDHAINTCVLTRDGDDYCYNGVTNTATTTYADRVEVYRNCTLQNTCTVRVQSSEHGNVKLVRYPYVCESNIQDISKPFSGRLSNPTFYFNGLDYIGQTMDCGCSVSKSSGNLIVVIFYLHGDNICNKFNILPNTQLVRCTVDGVQLYTAPENIQSNFLKMEIRNMAVTGDEVVFFKVLGDNLDVTCADCKISPVLVSTSSSSSKPSSTSTESTTTNLNSDHSTSDTNINTADFISKAEHEEKLKEPYAILGGILAVVIIINIVAIGIYCFIRKRNKAGKSSTVADQSSHTDYITAVYHQPDEIQYQGLDF